MNVFDPTQWADVGGWFVLMAVSLGTVVLVGVKIAGTRHAEWLDEPIGARRDDGLPIERRWRQRI